MRALVRLALLLLLLLRPANYCRADGEFDMNVSYIGQAEVRRGGRLLGFDEHHLLARFVFTPRVKLGILRLGVEVERYAFDFPARAELPESLQSASVIVGLDTRFSDSVLVRIEAQPGFYSGGSHAFGRNSFNVPFVAGGTYIYSPDLQFVLGVGINPNAEFPVLPGGGIRWKMARQWVLNAVLPKPQLEFEITKGLTLHAGGDIAAGSYRMPENFGRTRANARLNNAALDFTEIRTGIGADWKLSSAVTLSAEAGYVPYRNFDFHRTNVRYHQTEGAPYGGISLHAAF